MITIQEARQWLVEQTAAGEKVDCPACEQRVFIYKRKLNSGMAKVLIRAALAIPDQADADGWIHIHQIFGGRKQDHRDWPLLRWWNLLVPKDKNTETESASGYWTITTDGYRFLRGWTVPKRAHIYNNKIVGFSLETTTISEALGDPFNYAEVMVANGH